MKKTHTKKFLIFFQKKKKFLKPQAKRISSIFPKNILENETKKNQKIFMFLQKEVLHTF